ncbi:hypothetical protein HAX54_025267 [Datura stramonium]|uniref:Secreted protein n=1 Tax=Datura stramonium TaxID=4076 RepID=A0ABS8S7H5_DATST|nr:hypothetical protein [Datura stramonium]
MSTIQSLLLMHSRMICNVTLLVLSRMLEDTDDLSMLLLRSLSLLKLPPLLAVDLSVISTLEGRPCELLQADKYRNHFVGFSSSLLQSPVVSVWDCIVRKMRYSFRPEFV